MSNKGSFFYEDENENQNQKNTAPEDQDYAYKVVTEYKSRAWSVASFVLSLISLIVCCFSEFFVVVMVCAVLGIVFSIISRKTLGYFDGLSIAGLVVGIFCLVLGIFVMVVYTSGILEYLEEILNEVDGDLEGPDDFFF